MKMNNQWNLSIDKLMYWRINNWIKYDSKYNKLTLRIHYDQLLITSESSVIETLSMNSKMKGFYKDDVLILIVSDRGQEIRKLRFQIKSDVAKNLQKLGKHFPVINHSNMKSNNLFRSKYRNIEEVLMQAMEKPESSSSLTLPSNYGNFIKLCLLDPTFPEVVLETEKILKQELNPAEHDMQ